MVAQANEIIARPITKTLITSTGRTPKRSMAHPTSGERTSAARAPALTDPAMRVRLQPNRCDMGKMSTVRVVMAGAIRANTAVPEAATTTQP